MSNKAIDHRIIIKRDGQTQQQRMPQWLEPSSVPIDARTKEEFFNYLKAISKEIKFYDIDSLIANGTWEDFFNQSAEELNTLAAASSLPPHIALWNSFLHLYSLPQQLANNITKRHLDFYYGDVLRLNKTAPVPDKAHVVFELKKNTADTLLSTGALLLAGKDSLKKDLHYSLTHDIIVNKSVIASLKSLYVNPLNKTFIHHAPVANSADGIGAELDKVNPKWNAFGNNTLPPASIGFCMASEVLRMKEGSRTVKVTLTLKNLPANAVNNTLTRNLFNVSITGEKGWIGPKAVDVSIFTNDNQNFNASFKFQVTGEEPPVVAFDPVIHGNSFDTSYPVMQVLLNNEKSDFGYKDLANAVFVNASIESEVKGIKEMQLENDFGTLNHKKSFNPFGPSPDVNANFSIIHDEAFSKRLKDFSVDIEWKNIPAKKLGEYFTAYGQTSNSNDKFTATAAFKDGYNWEEKTQVVNLFETSNAQLNTSWKFHNPGFPVKHSVIFLPPLTLQYNKSAGQSLEKKLSNSIGYLVPEFALLQSYPILNTSFKPVFKAIINAYKEVRKGTVNLRLRHGFLFREHREKYTSEILRYSKYGGTLALPAEPFSPEIQSITLNYTATTAITSFDGITINDFIDEEIEFFHYGVFGQMREHAYSRNQNEFLSNVQVSLLPQYNDEAEFYIGLTGLLAEDSASLLFQAAEGSANPDKPKVELNWSVLCDNYWKALINDDFIFDTTNDLLTSGVIKFVIPREATTGNTIMPDGFLWLKATVAKDSDAVCNLLDVQANAAIVQFDDKGNEPQHLATALAANTISKLKVDVGAIKSVKQPYASFGGKMQENDGAYYIRVSERLRHKERSIANWDYERLILQHFPKVYKVKCINHASGTSFYQTGHTLVVVVPDLTNQNSIDPFKPKLDKNTLDNILTFLQEHSGSWVTHHISSPFYEPVKISVRIKLKKGYEFNYYEKLTDRKLQEFLSPWISNKATDIQFGGKITQSMIVKFLEELEYVDFISDLVLSYLKYGSIDFESGQTIEASNPASILVSHHHHDIFNY